MKHQLPLNIPTDHPAFAGHFPGMPIVPGVVLLDAVVHAIMAAGTYRFEAWQINAVKFLSPLKPGEAAVIEHELQASGSVRFDIVSGARPIVTGSISASPSPNPSAEATA